MIFAMPHDPEINATLYVSGELPRRMRRWFEAHLLECEDCWREVWFARLGRRVAEHAREAAPGSLRDGVRAVIRLSRTEADDPSMRRWFHRRRGS